MTLRDAWIAAAFVAGSSIAIAGVVIRARRDSADPARCVGLVPIENRCCAPGQALREGRCDGRPSQCPSPLVTTDLGCMALPSKVWLAGGSLRAGAGDWEAEGRVEPHEAVVAPFGLDAFEITEAAYAECVQAAECPALAITGEPGRAMRAMTRRDVETYCRFRGGRLPSDDEWTLAAGSIGSRRYPWGDTGAVCRRAAWGLQEGPCGVGFNGPELSGAHPDGATPGREDERIYDLAGNVAEWVACSSAEGEGTVRGGSFASALATDLRTWHARRLPADSRSPELGGRCAYDRPAATP
ncbi:MAG TPA: SUMF1/EgtB/PvdO family nonheme iron enzyme [Polyangiaceae bacterium]